MSVDNVKFEVELRRVFPNANRWEVRINGEIAYGNEFKLEVGERTLKEQIERADVEFQAFMDFITKPGVVVP